MRAFARSRCGDQNHLAGLYAGRAIARHHVGLDHDRLPGTERIVRHWTRRTAFGAENWRQIAPSVAVQEIVNDREAGIFDDAGRFDDLCRGRAGLEHRRNRIKGGIRRCMQIAIEFVRLAERETPQHLSRMIPERRGNLRHHDITRLDAAHARKLAGYAQIRRLHRRDAEIMNDSGLRRDEYRRARPHRRVPFRSSRALPHRAARPCRDR